ncbi:conserved protein of unknown function [Bradyrhizobium sp. ORS 285]|uniref:hypothetical protein n=1 Tax=Bradyrhizobium sp. ORS 285 TaxID=115808 RepID=UPI00024067F0|nr:hypothetical protein [Bradyrhizobium sp. ORS 285]CCD87823.1 conserved hypothetical protein [Bradyrhizobium sp. ORS 285]SMX61307.1 conserved protein of unknown function [Bradyrhizobium sp. ORS 285]
MASSRPRLVVGWALFVIALSTAPAWAQSAPGLGVREAPPQQPAPVAEPAPQPSNPGLVEELGKLFEKMSIIPLKRPEAAAEPPPTESGAAAPTEQPPQPPRQAVQPMAPKGGDAPPSASKSAPASGPSNVLKETGDTLSRLTTPSSMVSGRIVCPIATNGTPDCKLGADKLCQGKGYKEGKSLNTDSAETCSARVLIPGRQRKPGDCRTDTFVTSALCQ